MSDCRSSSEATCSPARHAEQDRELRRAREKIADANQVVIRSVVKGFGPFEMTRKSRGERKQIGEPFVQAVIGMRIVCSPRPARPCLEPDVLCRGRRGNVGCPALGVLLQEGREIPEQILRGHGRDPASVRLEERRDDTPVLVERFVELMQNAPVMIGKELLARARRWISVDPL